MTPGLLRSLAGAIPPPAADAIKQGCGGSVKHGLERKTSKEGLCEPLFLSKIDILGT